MKTEIITSPEDKAYALISAGTIAILSVPAMAVAFKWQGWAWSIADFIVMGILLFGMGFLFVQASRRTPQKYRALIIGAFIVALLWIWAELAVGIFTSLGS